MSCQSSSAWTVPPSNPAQKSLSASRSAASKTMICRLTLMRSSSHQDRWAGRGVPPPSARAFVTEASRPFRHGEHLSLAREDLLGEHAVDLVIGVCTGVAQHGELVALDHRLLDVHDKKGAAWLAVHLKDDRFGGSHEPGRPDTAGLRAVAMKRYRARSGGPR